MTFGVNALDWTNIGRKLQTRLAETVGETLSSTVTESVLTPFAYYDAATGAVLTTYSAYLDTSVSDAFTPADLVTTKVDEDGTQVVIDVTPLPLLYIGVDDEGNTIVTADSSAEGVDTDPDSGRSIAIIPAFNASEGFKEPLDMQNAREIYQTAVDTDTGWAPDYQMTDGSLTSGDSNTQYVFDYQTVDEVSNSDGTSWLRLKQRNGTESVFYYLPYSSETEYTTLVDSIPAEFTFADDRYLFPAGTELTAESVESGSVSTVEATSVASTLLSSTYDTSLTDLNTAYEAVLSGDITGGGGNGGNTGGSDSCPDNATYNTTNAKCECDDGYKSKMTTDGSGALLECNVTFAHSFWTTTVPKAKAVVVDNKWWFAGGGFVLLGGLGWISGMFRGSKQDKKQQTLGQLLDKAVGSGKEIDG